jgi:DNA-binding transcriptional ArsR family regulator
MPSDKPRSRSELRQISDLATLRALTHPVRIALIELLGVHGPMTATEAGERLGETPGNCSFHLRQLAKHGFVEEAGGGRGRARPWKITQLGMNISGEGEDPAVEIAADALGRLVQDRQLERFERWRRTRSSYPRAWQDAAIHSQTFAWVTPEELSALNERVIDLLLSLDRERLTDPSLRPPGSYPVELLVHGYPTELPAAAEE